MIESKPIFAEMPKRNEGTALRAIEWHDLTARINAARDLRTILGRDNVCVTASFADAAAGFFSELEEGKRAVNPDALEHGKSSARIDDKAENDAATGGKEK